MAVSRPEVGHMFGFSCHFCGHDNPGGSRFCNYCGSPLHLKACPQCEAVNDRAADHCSQCQAAFGLEAPPMAATAGPAGDHSPCYGVPAVSAVHSNIPELLAERPDPVAPNIQQSFDRNEEPDIFDLNDERGKSVPHVITMRDPTELVGAFMVPPTAQLHPPNRRILLILVIGMVTVIAYYLDRHFGLLTGGGVTDTDRTVHAMKGDEASTPVRSILPAKAEEPLRPPPESTPGDVRGVALREEGPSAMDEKAHLDGSTFVPAKDTVSAMAAGLGKEPPRPAGRADGVGQSRTLPRERAADDRNDVSATPGLSTFPIEPGQTTAQDTMKRGGAKNTGGYEARGTRRTLQDKGIPTPPISESTRPQKTCSQQQRILGLCD
jgi:Double zinc ribbon